MVKLGDSNARAPDPECGELRRLNDHIHIVAECLDIEHKYLKSKAVSEPFR